MSSFSSSTSASPAQDLLGDQAIQQPRSRRLARLVSGVGRYVAGNDSVVPSPESRAAPVSMLLAGAAFLAEARSLEADAIRAVAHDPGRPRAKGAPAWFNRQRWGEKRSTGGSGPTFGEGVARHTGV